MSVRLQSEEITPVSKSTIRRLVKDIADIIKNPLHEHGVYYKHDTDNMLLGYALIIGPQHTPYEYGHYLFTFDFPIDYPHTPPKVTFVTNDGTTRFNPNLYRDGKCCLSLLNTWKGEQWSSCQSITSVLLSMCTLLNEEPLLNEPGITKDHRDFHPYTTIIEFKNIEFAFLRIFMFCALGLDEVFEKSRKRILLAKTASLFREEITHNFTKHYPQIQEKLDTLIQKYPTRMYISTGCYTMAMFLDYPSLCDEVNEVQKKIVQ